jgi:hypothetical protein
VPAPHLKPRLVIGSHLPTWSRSSSYDESILTVFNVGGLADFWAQFEAHSPSCRVLYIDAIYGFGQDDCCGTHREYF